MIFYVYIIYIMIRLPCIKIIYDEPHTKDFYIDGKMYTVHYDINYCKNIPCTDLKYLEDGYYTYIIHDEYELIISKVLPFEDGSKHIQLLQKTKKAYIGGELKKNGDYFTVNMMAGLFRYHNPHILENYGMYVYQIIEAVLRRYGVYQITFTGDSMIDAYLHQSPRLLDVTLLSEKFEVLSDFRNMLVKKE